MQFLHLFFQTGNLFTQRLRQGAQFRFAALLVFTRLGAVNALFRRFVALVFLFLDIAQPLLIILQIAIKRLDFLVVYQIEVVGGGADQVTVVRDDNQRAFKIDQRLGQRLTHIQVQVVGWFIEQQQVRALPDDQRQYQTRFFATGEAACLFADFIALEAESTQVVTQFLLQFLRRHACQMLNG